MSVFSLCLATLATLTFSQPPNTITFTGNPIQYSDAPVDNAVFRFSEPRANEIIICYEEGTRQGNKQGLCRLGQLERNIPTTVFSKEFIYESGNASDPYLMPVPRNNEGDPQYLIGYTNAPDSSLGPGVSRLVYIENTDINSADIDFGAQSTTFNFRLNDQTQMVFLEQNPNNGEDVFVVCYSQGIVDQAGIYCNVGTLNVNGRTTYYDAVQVYGTIPTDGMLNSIVKIDYFSFLICFDSTIPGNAQGLCRIGNYNVTDNGLTFNNAYYLFGEGTAIDNINLLQVSLPYDDEGVLICYQTLTKGFCNFGFVYGGDNTFSVDFQEAVPFDRADPVDGITVTTLHQSEMEDVFVVCFDDVDGNNNSGGACLFGYLFVNTDTNRVEISYGNETGAFYTNSPPTDGQQVVDIGQGQLLLCYFDSDVGGYCDIGQLSSQ